VTAGKDSYTTDSLDYKVGQKVRTCRLAKEYTQKDLAKKIGVKYWLILQYEKGNSRIPIKKLYAIAEALSVSVTDLVSGVSNKSKGFEDEGEEILNLARKYKEIKDQELREIFYLLTKFIRTSEGNSGKVVKIEVAKNLVKEGVSADLIFRATNLSIDEYSSEKKEIPILYKVGQRIKEWRLRGGYTQEDLAKKVGITNQRIYEYEQGRAAVSLEMLNKIAKVLSISMTDLLPKSIEDEDSIGENELSNLIEEYKKIKNQELRDVLVKFLFEDIYISMKKVKKAKKVEIAKNLVREGISIDIIVQITGLSNCMIEKFL